MAQRPDTENIEQGINTQSGENNSPNVIKIGFAQ